MSDVLEVPTRYPPADVLDVVVRALESSDAGGRATSQLAGRDGKTIELPEGIHALLVSILENLRAGNGVSVIPLHAELTTIQAADTMAARVVVLDDQLTDTPSRSAGGPQSDAAAGPSSIGTSGMLVD